MEISMDFKEEYEKIQKQGGKTHGTSQYPYWVDEFEKEFKGLQVYYREEGWKKGQDDLADSYRVFMILCNNRYGIERMKVLEELKNTTEENPIKLDNEYFWTEKD